MKKLFLIIFRMFKQKKKIFSNEETGMRVYFGKLIENGEITIFIKSAIHRNFVQYYKEKERSGQYLSESLKENEFNFGKE